MGFDNIGAKTDRGTDRETETPTSAQNRELDNIERKKCMVMKKLTVSRSKGRDRGKGKGYGYVSSKVTKFICVRRNEAPVVPDIVPSRLDLSSARAGGISSDVRVRVSEHGESNIISAKEDVYTE